MKEIKVMLPMKIRAVVVVMESAVHREVGLMEDLEELHLARQTSRP